MSNITTWTTDAGTWFEITPPDENEHKLLLTADEFMTMWRDMSVHVEDIHKNNLAARKGDAVDDRLELIDGRCWMIRANATSKVDVMAWLLGYDFSTSPVRCRIYDEPLQERGYVVDVSWDDITKASSIHTHYMITTDHHPRMFMSISKAIGMANIELNRILQAA